MTVCRVCAKILHNHAQSHLHYTLVMLSLIYSIPLLRIANECVTVAECTFWTSGIIYYHTPNSGGGGGFSLLITSLVAIYKK